MPVRCESWEIVSRRFCWVNPRMTAMPRASDVMKLGSPVHAPMCSAADVGDGSLAAALGGRSFAAAEAAARPGDFPIAGFGAAGMKDSLMAQALGRQKRTESNRWGKRTTFR